MALSENINCEIWMTCDLISYSTVMFKLLVVSCRFIFMPKFYHWTCEACSYNNVYHLIMAIGLRDVLHRNKEKIPREIN